MDADKLVEKFNKKFKIGDKCKYRSCKIFDFEEVTVERVAFVANSGTPVVFFEEKSGYYSIESDFITL